MLLFPAQLSVMAAALVPHCSSDTREIEKVRAYSANVPRGASQRMQLIDWKPASLAQYLASSRPVVISCTLMTRSPGDTSFLPFGLDAMDLTFSVCPMS